MTIQDKIISLCEERAKRKQTLIDSDACIDNNTTIDLPYGGKIIVSEDGDMATLIDDDGSVTFENEHLDSTSQLIVLSLRAKIIELEILVNRQEI